LTRAEATREAQRLNREQGARAGRRFFPAGQDHFWVEVETAEGWTVERRRVTGRSLKPGDLLEALLGAFSPSSRQQSTRDRSDE